MCPGAQGACEILVCIRKSIASKLREVILLVCLDLVRQIWSAVSSSGQEEHGASGVGPLDAAEVLKGLEHLCLQEMLSKLCLFSLERRHS